MSRNLPSIDNYYRSILNSQIKSDILSEDSKYLLEMENKVDELVNYYLEKYSLQPIELTEANAELNTTKRLVRAHEREELYRHQGDTYRDESSIQVKYTMKENKDINSLKGLSGNQRSLSWSRDDFTFGSNYISISFITEGYGISKLSPEQIIEKIKYIKSQIETEVGYINNGLEVELKKLAIEIKNMINQRISKIKQDEQLMNELYTASPIPITKKKMGEVGYHANIQKKDFVKIVSKPKGEGVKDLNYPILDPKIYNDILQYIENLGRQFEKTPNSYNGLTEEHLRDIILVSLNGIFENSATGETFAKKGKTDIYLVIDKGNILKFECKYRKGVSIVEPTINQLLDYTTWRDNYGSIILFIKAKGRTAILQKIEEQLQLYPTIIGNVKKINESHFQCTIRNPDDSKKTLHLTCLCFFIGGE